MTRQATDLERVQATHALLTAIIDCGDAGAATDDAHERYELPPTCDPRVWGAVTAGLQAAGVIKRVGECHTRRRVAHGRRIGRYVAADRAGARRRRDQLAESAARSRPTQLTLPLDDDLTPESDAPDFRCQADSATR